MHKLQRSFPFLHSVAKAMAWRRLSQKDFKYSLWKETKDRLVPYGWSRRFFIFGIVFILVFGIVEVSKAQQTDTSRTTKEIELEEKSFPQPYHSERSTNNFLLPSSGTYGIPEPTEYYKPPFMGQKHLDAAVEAYRKRLEEGLGNSLLFQFISKIAPFVNNQFQFGVYRIYDLPIVDRDHPLLDPQVGEGEAQQDQ